MGISRVTVQLRRASHYTNLSSKRVTKWHLLRRQHIKTSPLLPIVLTLWVAQIRPLADKIFYSSKTTMHIYSYTKFKLSILITSRHEGGSQNPRRHHGCVHAPLSRKIFNLKLLIISIHLPNFSFLTLLLPEIWSLLFPIGLTLRGPRNGFFNMVGVNISNLSSL